MLASAPFLLLHLRCLPPSLLILGSAPTFITAMALLRALTLPLPPSVFWRAEERLYSAYQAMVGFFFESWSGVEFCFYGDPLPQSPENVLYISNHQCSVDWVIPEVLCVKQGGWGGRARYILKDAIKFVPLYGWVLGERGGIYIKRQRGEDHQRLSKGLSLFVQKDMPLWLVIFPEGTRFDPCRKSKIEQSQKFAKSLGLPSFEQVLTPRTTGFELAMAHIGHHFSAVYDLTICYEGFSQQPPTRSPSPNLFGFYSGQCRRVHVHLRRVPITDIPETREQQRDWLYAAFGQKERMIAHFLAHHSFDAPHQSLPFPLTRWGLPLLFFSSVLLLALARPWGRVWWAATPVLLGAVGAVRMACKTR